MDGALELLADRARAFGFAVRGTAAGVLAIDVGEGAWLEIGGEVDEDGPRIGFAGGEWHVHGICWLRVGNDEIIALDAAELVEGFASGSVLVAERHLGARLVDRWPVHVRSHEDFDHLEEGESLVLRPAHGSAQSSSSS